MILGPMLHCFIEAPQIWINVMVPFLDTDIAEVCQNLGEDAAAFSGKTISASGARGFLGRYFTEMFAYLNKNVLEKPCTLRRL